MSDIRRFASFDGQEIAYQVLGAGRPTLMIHGFLADAQKNWIQPGIAAAVAAVGRQVILPDLRGHGASAAPTDLAYWPADALALDQAALVAHGLRGGGVPNVEVLRSSLAAPAVFVDAEYETRLRQMLDDVGSFVTKMHEVAATQAEQAAEAAAAGATTQPAKRPPTHPRTHSRPNGPIA